MVITEPALVFRARGREVELGAAVLFVGVAMGVSMLLYRHELAARLSGARVWGPSARFDGQRVGRDHEVLDGDVVEILE